MTDFQERIAKAIAKMRDTPTLLQWDERLPAKIERALRAAEIRAKDGREIWPGDIVMAGIEEFEKTDD